MNFVQLPIITIFAWQLTMPADIPKGWVCDVFRPRLSYYNDDGKLYEVSSVECYSKEGVEKAVSLCEVGVNTSQRNLSDIVICDEEKCAMIYLVCSSF